MPIPKFHGLSTRSNSSPPFSIHTILISSSISDTVGAENEALIEATIQITADVSEPLLFVELKIRTEAFELVSQRAEDLTKGWIYLRQAWPRTDEESLWRGKYILELVPVDLAGNRGESRTLPVTIDSYKKPSRYSCSGCQ